MTPPAPRVNISSWPPRATTRRPPASSLVLPSVRRGGGPRPGLYYWALGSSKAPKRLTSTLAGDRHQQHPGRVHLQLEPRRPGGPAALLGQRQRPRPGLAPAGRPAQPAADALCRRLLQDGHVQATRRFAGSGGPFTPSVVDANRALPATTDSLGLQSDRTSAPSTWMPRASSSPPRRSSRPYALADVGAQLRPLCASTRTYPCAPA